MGPRAGLDRWGKSRPPPGFDPRTVQAIASRYTDYATRLIWGSRVNIAVPKAEKSITSNADFKNE